MIKLLDILKEDVNSPEFNKMHIRDHFNAIAKCVEMGLKSTDPETLADQAAKITDHAQAIADKNEASYAKANPSQSINSNISNSYSGTDSDITSPEIGV